jgi:hypothetical protein
LTPAALLARFASFIEHGDDPRYYPISGNRILAADKKEQEQHLKLFEHWRENAGQAFIGVTIQDTGAIIKNNKKLTESQAAYVAKLLEYAGSGLAVQMFSDVYKALKSTESADILYDSLKGTKVFKDIEKAMQQHDKMVRTLREQKKKTKSREA